MMYIKRSAIDHRLTAVDRVTKVPTYDRSNTLIQTTERSVACIETDLNSTRGGITPG